MANKHETLAALFTAIAGAIRTKSNSTGEIVADSFPEAIAAIPTEGSADITWENVRITPKAEGYTLTASEGRGIRSVTVEGDSDLKPENVAKGVTIFDVTGTLEEAESGEAELQDKLITENGVYTADSGYDGLGIVTVAVEGEGGGSVIPEPYASYIEEAKAVYTGEYANVIYAEGYGTISGKTYHTVMFLLDNWQISAYDAATTEYKHSGCYIVQKEDDGEWVLSDYSTITADKHYAKNIKYADCYIEYNGMTLFPVGIGYYPAPIAYLYNGVRLPKLPEWDKETYPYAYIGERSGSAEYQGQIVLWFTKGEAKISSSGTTIYNLSQSNAQYYLYEENTNKWNGFEYSLMAHMKVFWTNTDIINTDGSVYCAASNPIPVYE